MNNKDYLPYFVLDSTQYKSFSELYSNVKTELPQNERPCSLKALTQKEFLDKFAVPLRDALNAQNITQSIFPYVLSHAYLETGGGNSSLVCYNNFTGVKEYTDKHKYVSRWTWEQFPISTFSKDKMVSYINSMRKKGFSDVDVYKAWTVNNNVWVYIKEPFRSNTTIQEGFEHYLSLLKRRYPQFDKQKSAYDFAYYLAKSGYGTADPYNYAKSVQNLSITFEKLLNQ